jgi:hypothetical protein
LVIVYLAILYAYLLKILIQWNWPKGWVSSLILGFSATAILSLLLMHPIRDRSGNAWIRVAGRWLYVVLIPLIVVLFLAVMERIGDYGITERRYAGVVLGIWLSAQVLYFLFSGSKSIKFTIGSLCLFAFLMSSGPWGMLSVTQRSQAGRLQKLLAKNGILVSGSIKKEHDQVPQEDAREITSIVSYLRAVHGYDAIQPWFSERLREQTDNGYGQNLLISDVLHKMGVEYVDYGAGAGMIRFNNLNSKMPVDIAGYDRILRQQVVAESGNRSLRRFEGEGISYELKDGLDAMTITIGNNQTGFETVQVDIAGFAKKLLSQYGSLGNGRISDIAPEAMTLMSEHNNQKAKIFFRQLYVRRRRDNVEISFINIDIAYTVRK